MSNAREPRVVSITYTPRGTTPRRPQGNYARVPVERVELAEFKGIVGDVRGGTGKRQLNIMSSETLAELSAEGFRTGPGEMGEQIVVSGLDLATIPVGGTIQLGAAVVEVTLPRTGCGRFEMIQGKPKDSVVGRLGVMARVVTGGTVAIGDRVDVLPGAG